MSIIERNELDYVRGVARRWYRENAAIDTPEAQERAAQWETVLLAESLEDISKALDEVMVAMKEANEQEGEANG